MAEFLTNEEIDALLDIAMETEDEVKCEELRCYHFGNFYLSSI